MSAPSAPQYAKLWAEADERGWRRDQVYGRASEINALALDREHGLSALSVSEMSRLIDAVIHEPIWVDPRQLALGLDGGQGTPSTTAR